MIRILWRKKVLVVFLAALLILFPGASVRPAQALSKTIFLSVGVEKSAGGYTVIGAAMINAEETKLVSAEGAAVEEAFGQITSRQGRTVSLAHCNLIVLGASLSGENVANILEYFLEKFEVSNNALLVWTNGDVKGMLEASFKSKTDAPGGMLETIAAHNQLNVFKRPLTLDRFFKDYFGGRVAFMSAISFETDEIYNTGQVAAFKNGLFKRLVAQTSDILDYE